MLENISAEEMRIFREKSKIESDKMITEFIRENKKGRGSFLNLIKNQQQQLFVKAYSGKSKASGIKAKCLDCSCFQKEEITNCEVFTCPLYEYRPYQPTK